MSADALREQLQREFGASLVFERELPRGGMSRVFVARDAQLGRQVVVKVLAPELTATLSAERFKREISLAARLQHPNIVPLLSAGEVAHRLYYTMPLVDGESLRDRMSAERPMAIDAICRILEDVAGAIAYANAEGIIHRDMKPENVMFFHGRAVVLDFGIGKALTASHRADETRITQAGMSLGTPMYIAPEQGMGDLDLDHRADIYALGVLAYEMFTGHPPFAGRTPQAVMDQQRKGPPPPVISRRADAPPGVAQLVMQCLSFSPDARPGSAEAMVDAVRARHPNVAPAGTGAARIPAWVPWAIAVISTTIAIGLAVRRG